MLSEVEAMGAQEQKEIIKALMNCRSKKLRHRINQLLKLMNFFGRDLRVQQAVDQSYYIQKQQELETLEEKLSESLKDALKYMNRLEHSYNHVSARWKKDFVSLKRIIGRTVEMENNQNTLSHGPGQIKVDN